MKPNFTLRHNETASEAIIRLYKHIRTMQRDFVPKSNYAARIQANKSIKPILRIVK